VSVAQGVFFSPFYCRSAQGILKGQLAYRLGNLSIGTVDHMEAAMTISDQLAQRILDRTARVGVVGLGYVGLPFAVEKAKVGFEVIGIDRSQARVDQVNRGENYIGDVDDIELQELVTAGLIRATTNFDVVSELDVIVIAVPTPLTKNLNPDLQYVQSVTAEIAPRLRPGQLISLESTTYPGTTEEVMLPVLATSGLVVESDYFLAHSPERVDPGNLRYTTKNTTKVVGGVGPASLHIAELFYSQTIEHVVTVSSARAAEMVKVFENTFRAVNIALVNELALLCDRMGQDVWEVLDAAFTKPFGIMPFYPGPGVGGHCIPLDPHYLEWKAREFNFNTRFIALAGEINRRMPEFVRDKTVRILGRNGVASRGANVLALGVSYKKNLGDWRESPSVDVITLLEQEGINVCYHDPHVASCVIDSTTRTSVELTDELVANSDLVLILTDHDDVDHARVVQHARHVFDTRNATRMITATNVTLL
jgi:UDP-N-acetyl-D-glucosamine dehydrogenase